MGQGFVAKGGELRAWLLLCRGAVVRHTAGL